MADLKNLPKLGLGFKWGKGTAGKRGAEYEFSRIRRKNYKYRNLSEKNFKQIEGALKPYDRSLRKKGGVTRLQARKAQHKLWKTFKATRGQKDAFTKEDFRDGKEIINYLKRSSQRAMESKNRTAKRARPYEDASKLSALHSSHSVSISDSIRKADSHLSSTPVSSPHGKPPSIPLSR